MNHTDASSIRLNSKHHFDVLDGLRGIAAIAVVVFHFVELAVPNFSHNFIIHAYLSVDFFFCLSGFVIAYAYDNRLRIIGKIAFFKLRLIRLHPLVFIGAILGLLSFVFNPFSHLYQLYGFGKTTLMFLSAGLLIPYPVVRERSFYLFHLNPPTWSLFWEYFANVVYAFVLIKIRNKTLWLLTGLAAIVLFYEAHRSGSLGLGWGGYNIISGGIRVGYSFLAGLLIYRSGWVIKSSLGFLSVGLLLLMAFLVPYEQRVNWLADSALVIFYFPFLVALGAGVRPIASYHRICKFLGDVSYPLYIVHYPFIWLYLGYLEKKKPALSQLAVIIPISTVLLIGFAYILMIYVDEPVRHQLKKRLIKQL